MNTQELPYMEEIKGFPDYYVTKCGRIFSTKKGCLKELKPALNSRKYYTVNLARNGSICSFKVHQLVAIQYLNHKPCGMVVVVDHIDNNKSNNHVSNLQLTNMRHNTVKDMKRELPTGVRLNNRKFQSRIYYNGKQHHIGMFKCPIEAGIAYQKRLAEIESEGK